MFGQHLAQSCAHDGVVVDDSDSDHALELSSVELSAASYAHDRPGLTLGGVQPAYIEWAHPTIRRTHMNWDRIEGQWKQIKGQVTEQWGKLTDDDLEVVDGKREQLSGKIQQRYGVMKDEADRQITAWEARADERWFTDGGSATNEVSKR
jgi:uncharacterized protein YjbJ (UPF0337 family)